MPPYLPLPSSLHLPMSSENIFDPVLPLIPVGIGLGQIVSHYTSTQLNGWHWVQRGWEDAAGPRLKILLTLGG